MTLKSTILEAYDVFLEDDRKSRIGQTVETSYDKLFYYDIPEYKSGDAGKRAATVYEPWFTLLHGEQSGLEGTLTEPQGLGKA